MRSSIHRQYQKKQFVFVILHYITTHDTSKCVDSIRGNIPNAQIIIVDNGSPNNSYNTLQQEYATDQDVVIIHCDKNLGFTGGNNIGFKFAKEHFDPDYIILCNNDTQVLSDFTSIVEQRYRETHFAVLGPRERLPNGDYYPLIASLPTKEWLKKHIERLESIKKHPIITSIKSKFREHLDHIFHRTLRYDEPCQLDVNSKHRNIVLHGAFLIFSKEYIRRFDGLDNKTFLYGEEQILTLQLKKAGLTSLYDPSITIFHNHHSATKVAGKNRLQSFCRRINYEIESSKIVMNELDRFCK